jgi:hypothetical protein
VDGLNCPRRASVERNSPSSSQASPHGPSDADLEQSAEADRQEVDPPVQGGDGDVVERRPTRLVREGAAGMVGSGMRC